MEMLSRILFTLLIATAVFGDDGPTAKVKQGSILGKYEKSTKGRIYAAYKGIPYAKAPIGENRFKEPSEPQPWKGTWNATNFGGICMQFAEVYLPGHDRIQGNEDCLYVNVYTPQINSQSSSEPMDVIIFIHGGGFMWGSGNHYSAKNLMDRDVVYATFNYRLNIFGFLSTEDEHLPGNLGLKDQNAALRWIKNNIAAFGGNPNSITITGLSAGGASVHYHYLSPMSKGLFTRGISFSGTALCSWTQAEAAREKAQRLASQVGCPTKPNKALVECLKYRPALQLVEQIDSFQIWMYNPFNVFGPVVEKGSKNPFIDEKPIDIVRQGKAQDLPWITGVVTEEGLYPFADFMANETLVEEFNLRYLELAPYVFDFNYTVERDQHQIVAQKIKEYYVGKKPFSRNTFKEMIKMISDRIFVVDIERTARLHSAVNSAPVYFHEFGYRGEHSFGDIVSNAKTNLGVCHGDDVIFVIPFVRGQNPPITQQDKDMTEKLLDFWTTFAKTGVPSFGGVQWKPVNPEKTHYLRIDNPYEAYMSESDDLGNRKLWDSLPINEPQVGVMPKSTKGEL